MTHSEEFWQAYIRRLSALDQTAGQLLAQYIQRHGVADSEALAQYAYALATKYGEASAELACQMYDTAAEAAGAQVPAAVPAPTASPQDVQRMVMGALQSPPLLRNGVARLVKQAAADTTLQNAARDGAEFAWVPHGDSCAFCITLASRGWQRMGKKAREGIHATHIHANCDCEYAVRFDGKSGVAGYDPDRYLAQYNAAGGDIKAMRRAQYAENKDKINAQKRAAYKARKEREQEEKTVAKPAGTVYNRKNTEAPKISPEQMAAFIENAPCVTTPKKYTGYFLQPGAKHADQFFNVGYTQEDPLRLRYDMARQFDMEKAVDFSEDLNGTTSFSIFMDLGVDKIRTFRTVWKKDTESSVPRIITAHREDPKK